MNADTNKTPDEQGNLKGNLSNSNFSGNLFDIWQGQLRRQDWNQKQMKERKAAISELIKPVNSTKFLRHH